MPLVFPTVPSIGPLDPVYQAIKNPNIDLPTDLPTFVTKQESSENVQDVGMGEDIVKDLGDKNNGNRWTDYIQSDEYGGLDFNAYKIYERKSDSNDAESLFEITVDKSMYVQDSPIGGSAQAGTINSGESYAVSGVALDADGNEWFRVDVDGKVKWVSAEALDQKVISFKDAEGDQKLYDNIKNGPEWSNIVQYMVNQNAQLANYINSNSKNDTVASAFGQTEYTIGGKTYELVSGFVSDTNRTYLDYKTYMNSMTRIMGLPPQWSVYADPNVEYGAGMLIGRRYSQIILSNPTIVSLCPGKLAFSKGVVDNLLSIDWNNTTSASLAESLGDNGVDMLWKFEETWDINYGGYLSYVNALCRYAVACLSTTEQYRIISDGSADAGDMVPLMDRPLPAAFGNGSAENGFNPFTEALADGTGYKGGTYRHIDLSGLLGSTVIGGTFSGGDVDTHGTLWGNIVNTLSGYANAISSLANTAKKAAKTANINHFVHFAATGQANVRESFATETRSSSLEQLVGSSVSDSIKDLSFIVGAGFAQDSDVMGDINNLKNAVDTKYGGLSSILNTALDIAKGGTVAWPQMVGDVSWGREYTFNVKFISPYGDAESRFLNTIMPYICLMCMWLPKQLETAMDMYTWPFVVQAYAQGIFACPVGVLTNIEVSHGGGEEPGWTGNGEQTEIDVAFSITPLHHKLSMSNGNFFFLKNVGIQNYMGTICGIDLTMPQKQLIKETANRLFDDWVAEQPARIEASVASRIHDSSFLQFLAFLNKEKTNQNEAR